MPYRGLDSTYQNQWGSKGLINTNPNSSVAISVTPDASMCNHYEPYKVEEIPHISAHVKAALDFLSKDDDSFFLMYEQGDVSVCRLFFLWFDVRADWCIVSTICPFLSVD